jgi:hypothetical protein
MHTRRKSRAYVTSHGFLPQCYNRTQCCLAHSDQAFLWLTCGFVLERVHDDWAVLIPALSKHGIREISDTPLQRNSN